MKWSILIIFALLPTLAFASSNQERLSRIDSLRRIAFGSCNKQYFAQPVWHDLTASAPDLFIWAGDNIYANTNDIQKVKEAYQAQNQIEEYKFFKSLTPIIGTWDDHDYGNNDQDGKFAIKKQSRDYALDFLEEPLFSERRLRDGIYTHYVFGKGNQKVLVILIDNRYFLHLEKSSPILGSAQWQWLEETLKEEASLILLVSGLSVISPAAPGSEEWADYPTERARLRSLLEKTNKPYLYLTGDKHFSSIFERNGELEFMSSGMTHNTRLPLRPYVMARYPNPVFENNYGMIDIRWEESQPILDLSIRTAWGLSLNQRTISWKQKKWKTAN